MTLTAISIGDIVQVDDGMPFYAKVMDKGAGTLVVSPLHRPTNLRTVKARQVIAHWRASRRLQSVA